MGIVLGISYKRTGNSEKETHYSLLAYRYWLIAIGYWLLAIGSFSQEVIKSKKIETIEGKKYYMHTIEKGQTLYAISKEYSLTVNEIVIENPDAIDGISPGQILRIPMNKVKKEKPLTTADSANFAFHKVEARQTLYSISKMYGVSIETLNAFNPELKEGLKVGQIIKIPRDKKTIKEEKKKLVVEEKKMDQLSKKPAIESKTNIFRDSINPFKAEYRIALFLPFNIEKKERAEKDSLADEDPGFSNKTKLALEFYEGVKMAFDSITKAEFKAKLFVYDLDEEDTAAIRSALKKPELAKMDLIIGPLYSSGFMQVACFAREHQIAIVSPISQINKVLLDNIYTSKASASATTQLESMANYIVENYGKEHIFVLNNTNIKELPYVTSFERMTNEIMSKSGHDSIKEVLCNGKDYSIIHKNLKDSMVNVVVMPLINSQSFVTEAVNTLYADHEKNKIVLFGMQNWANYDNLDIDYLNELSLHLPVNFLVDYNDSNTKHFINKYRSIYKTEPGTNVYQGFDVTWFYLNGLNTYGVNLQRKLPEMKEKGIQTSFDFYQTSAESGYENRFCYVLKYSDYKLVEVK